MNALQHLTDRLTQAARDGQPLPDLTADDRAHLAACDRCQVASAALLVEAIGAESALVRLLDERERRGLLVDPPGEPAFDLSFLDAPAAAPWLTAAPLANAAGAASQRVRELAGDVRLGVRVFRRGLQVAFDELPAWLLPNTGLTLATAGRPSRATRQATPDVATLTLLDQEENLAISVAVQATGQSKSLVRVRVAEITSDRPLSRVLVSMSRPDGKDAAETRDGDVLFHGVEPAEYAIELRLLAGERAGQIWRFPLSLNVADPA